jgi:nucleoside 2-deoxyribosyltransferase
MPTCFVIQPFDKGRFDKRYEQVFVPAIKAAGLEPYRVDKDVASSIPIESIERGIQDAAVCLADITTDNPNVWYELGYAYASGTPVVMVCAAVREGKVYPFDIQHRTVTSYHSDAPNDFAALGKTITERLQAELKKGLTIKKLASSESVVAPIDGLSPNEMSILALLGGNVLTPTDTQSLWSLQQEAEKAGMTKLGCNLAIRKLSTKKLVEARTDEDHNGEPYDAVAIADLGWNWIESNEQRFQLRKTDSMTITDEDIPF